MLPLTQCMSFKRCTQDSDMVGVEGVTDPDNTWEGLGTISLGR